ncbi:MAG: M20/M25/M40 family metallo-hydrolase [Anaerolineaceae bacterium]|nr:M20/M25/M40 family metallo-hydrolase [Anaerolineaceae bacterium]
MNKQKLVTYIDEQKEEIIKQILKLVSFQSITGNKEENLACLKYFLQHAQEIGFKTMTTSEWDVGIVEMGQGEKTLGILVHLDVVGIGDREKWTNDPFVGIQRDGYLYGRGTEDDKGAAIMSLYAMKAVQQLGLPLYRKVWLIVGTSEEGKWTDIANFKREFPVPCCGYSPDGRFPIFNIEKGYADINLDFFRDGKRGIKKLHGGDSPNTIPSRAKITLPDGKIITVHGKAIHSSVPKSGDNAIIKLCKKLSPLAEMEFDFVRFIRDFLSNDGHAHELLIHEDRKHSEVENIGHTTISPTMITLTENSVRLTINIRHKYGTTREEILTALTAHADEYSYKVTILDFLEPMWMSKEHPFIKTLQDVSAEYGMDNRLQFAPGTSYAKSMKNFVSWGPVLPDEPATAHIEDERLSIDTMMLATKLYAGLISRMTIES